MQRRAPLNAAGCGCWPRLVCTQQNHRLAVLTHLLEPAARCSCWTTCCSSDPAVTFQISFTLLPSTLRSTASLRGRVLTSIAGLLEGRALLMVHLASFPPLVTSSVLEITFKLRANATAAILRRAGKKLRSKLRQWLPGEGIHGGKSGCSSRNRSWKRQMSLGAEPRHAAPRRAALLSDLAAAPLRGRVPQHPQVSAHICAPCWWRMRRSPPRRRVSPLFGLFPRGDSSLLNLIFLSFCITATRLQIMVLIKLTMPSFKSVVFKSV